MNMTQQWPIRYDPNVFSDWEKNMKKIVIAKIPIKNQDSLMAVCYEDGQPVECFVRPQDGELTEGSIFTGLVEKVDARLETYL